MSSPATNTPLHGLEPDSALRAILEGTATETGERFFQSLVQNLARALNTHGAWVTEYFADTRRLRALAFWMDGRWVQNYEVDIAGSPCERVIDTKRLVHFPDRLLELYPNEPDVLAIGAVSYMGVPLEDTDGTILGHLAVIDRRPLPEEPRIHAIFQIFAARAAAELRRLRSEAQVREREEKLSGLVRSALDAIIELDDALTVTRLNPAAEDIFSNRGPDLIGRHVSALLTVESSKTLTKLIDELRTMPEGRRSLWIAGGLTARRGAGAEFPAEATLSQFELRRRTFYTLILRDVNERLEAERKIRSLTAETELLRQELQALQQYDAIIGESAPLRHVLRDVAQVAETDATVLIMGETGTGKELIARAIHGASRRRERPLVTVNCAAIPSSLIESEFFGHEPGAFTGATKRREGRFALADKGTIFLDEIGELPLDLQGKLLRVLQEGEFEPVGSSYTKKIDVRVLAATNRDLAKAVREGKFREDLFYRLNVFPIPLPPLRERGDDVIRIAQAFAQRFAQRMGKTIAPLTPECIRRLKAYSWPGNVRELQNVIERAVITARDGRLNLDRALPEVAPSPVDEPISCRDGSRPPIRTMKELEAMERENILRALETADWKVSGDKGAARLLGMNPSTLASRMKALGISRRSRS
ncbi:DNA-binding protein Fis / transcriptional regulator, Fis family [Nitrospira tepida]|uniref:DNA-binding protein Fis / transcriptional regulator, Fis family n=1 Tax=Nitrospira tepida TaxID=2973512 RepID=A0AA86MWG0_9BACT|nr:sigma 54-interacting transcriptional regulator [Nitrospira tepida]CAI4030326.1 DNA-binding protein Fis / transcriptional regulator, Fis family [Nitrospira tepida]